jgi:hypothetical protein
MASLPGAGRESLGASLAARIPGAAAAAGTPALAFRAVQNSVSNWSTAAGFAADFDGDGRSDVAGWDGAAWRLWHADGYDGTLNWTEYTHNLPAALLDNSARLVADFDGDGSSDVAYWDGSAWQFLRAEGAIGTAFSFAALNGDLGSVAGGNTSQIVLGDFDGDGREDVAAWNGSAWAVYVSAASPDGFYFTPVANNLGSLAGGDATVLAVGDFDGDGLSDLAARNDVDTAWVVWRSTGMSAGEVQFQVITATSLGVDMAAAAARRIGDFNGDGKSDVLGEVSGEVEAWLGQGVPDAMPFQAVDNNLLQFAGQPVH